MLFVVIYAAVMCATLMSFTHVTKRIYDAQHAQFAADASAIGCVLSNQRLAPNNSEIFATQNGGTILRLDFADGQCVVLVQTHSVVRHAIAVSITSDELPTLKR